MPPTQSTVRRRSCSRLFLRSDHHARERCGLPLCEPTLTLQLTDIALCSGRAWPARLPQGRRPPRRRLGLNARFSPRGARLLYTRRPLPRRGALSLPLPHQARSQRRPLLPPRVALPVARARPRRDAPEGCGAAAGPRGAGRELRGRPREGHQEVQARCGQEREPRTQREQVEGDEPHPRGHSRP